MPSALQLYNFWHTKSSSSEITVECLLPNGICVSLPLVRADTSLRWIKTELWKKASGYSLFHLLKTMDDYVFVVVSRKGGTEELLDEELSLYDVEPVRPFLKVVKRQGNDEAKLLNSKISMLIGRTITPTCKNEEVDDMRQTFTSYCDEISQKRGCSSWERRAIYTYPPEFCESEKLPEVLLKKLEYIDNRIQISVSMMNLNSSLKNIIKTVEVAPETCPQTLIDIAMRKRSQTLNLCSLEPKESYVLKICGRSSFFLGQIESIDGNEAYIEKPMIHYKYIRQCLLWNKKPRLTVVPKRDLDVVVLYAPTVNREVPPILPQKGISKKLSLWEINRAHMLKIKIVVAMNVNAGHMWKEVHCGIFHGGEEVCEKKCTSLKEGVHPHWNEFLEFDMPIADLPRMARFCFSIVGYQQKDTRKRKPALIAWVNIPAFNYKGSLRMGSDRLYCWQSNKSIASGTKSFAYPLGTVSQSGNENGPSICVEFMKFEHPVIYPIDEKIFEYAAKAVEGKDGVSHPYLLTGGKIHRKQVEEIIKKDTLADMLEEDKELLWHLRAECYHDYPQSLPKLLQCVKWNSHEYVAQMRFLLQTWRKENLEVEIALDLLDYKFPDLWVRELAVKVLERLSDGDLEMYLLHLVQALKYESYLKSELAKYLLKRALNNRRIGHYLFWHLKAEVSNPEYSTQFGLLLEMYCRGAVEHTDILLKQVEAINKMKTVTEYLKAARDLDDRKKLALMRQCFNGPGYIKAFSNVVSPLDPSIRLKGLRVDKCKYMDSKKKPLWLVFQNADEEADDVMIIFKNGDDLRQDLLTLLSFRLMDNVWKRAGFDYGMNLYGCLPTGPMVGLIEVVTESDTLGRIQASKGGAVRGVWQEENLYSYLKEKVESNEEKLQTFIENFTKSVVGYSVATYVLGVGDRHNDNIMMKYDTGQLFHIDFGHFLGNFKSKFGIKRERVKFVLTNDILHLISKREGQTVEENFERFKNMCIEAFKTLRSKGNLFITLFAMLLSTGIPELEHSTDIDYLRDSLALTTDEPNAVNHFDVSFKEAYANKFSTTMNWMIHNLSHRWIDSGIQT